MDSFSEPQRRQEYSLAEVRDQVRRLEEEHRAKGIELSGRIIHVSHYLPFSAALKAASSSTSTNGVQPGIPSPPQTPPAKATDIPPSPSSEVPPSQQQVKASDERWNVSVRYGHSAMVSGTTSLSATHEQLFVGWTGDIHGAPSSPQVNGSGAATPAPQSELAKVPTKDISDADKEAFERIVNARGAKLLLKEDAIPHIEEDGEPLKAVEYVPVWLDDKQAHGHYDGYCKQSESYTPCRFPYRFVRMLSLIYPFPCYVLLFSLAIFFLCSGSKHSIIFARIPKRSAPIHFLLTSSPIVNRPTLSPLIFSIHHMLHFFWISSAVPNRLTCLSSHYVSSVAVVIPFEPGTLPSFPFRCRNRSACSLSLRPNTTPLPIMTLSSQLLLSVALPFGESNRQSMRANRLCA